MNFADPKVADVFAEYEARNAAGDMFGEARLKNVFSNNRDPNRLFDEIIDGG